MIPKLEVNGVSYSYHSLDGETLALSNISFDVSAGEFVAVYCPLPFPSAGFCRKPCERNKKSPASCRAVPIVSA